MTRQFLLSALILISSMTQTAFADPLPGDPVPNFCWKDSDENTVCLNDFSGSVRVILFNQGYCGLDHELLDRLVPRVQEFNEEPVRFLSVSISGMEFSKPADAAFLKELKKKHDIPFPVLGSSPKKEDWYYFKGHGTPFHVIIDQEGKFVLSHLGSDINRMFSKIWELIVH